MPEGCALLPVVMRNTPAPLLLLLLAAAAVAGRKTPVQCRHKTQLRMTMSCTDLLLKATQL
jgi:hypothetical protein